MSTAGTPPDRGAVGDFLLRAVVGAIIIVALTATATAAGSLLWLQEKITPPAVAPPPIKGVDEAERVAPPGGPQTLLLLGSDQRWDELRKNNPKLTKSRKPRSDTILLVRIDPDRDVIAVLSIPRDLKTVIPGHGVDKINGAYEYGGPALMVKVLEDKLPGLNVNHVINVNFRGFRQAVTQVGCVYDDVDRRYYHSNAGLPPGQRWAEIDVDPGYQRLCGQRALDYVRYRHTDTDLVRAARQQDFLRSAKDQIGTSQLIDNSDELIKIFRRNTQTTKRLTETSGVLRLAKLALYASDKPIVQIKFRGQMTGDNITSSYVEATPEQLRRVMRRFLGARAPTGTNGGEKARKVTAPTKKARRPRTSRASARLVDGRGAARQAAQATVRSGRVGFPLYAPAKLTPNGRYASPDTTGAIRPRTYELRDRGGAPHKAYRLVIAEKAGEGQYYGVQGTTWRTPPLLAHKSGTVKVRGRTLELYKDGSHLRFVAWRKGRAVYWVSNTLSTGLSNAEMLGIAASLTRVRR